MIRGTSKVLRINKKKRIYPGEDQSYLLIRWLNHPHNCQAGLRVASLLEVCKKLSDEVLPDDFPAASLNPRRPGLIGSKSQFANFRRVSGLVNKLNKALANFRLRPHFEKKAGLAGRVSWFHATNKNRLNIGILAGGNYDEIPFDEGDAIWSLLRLFEEGRLHRLRKCACGKWFYGRFSHQAFCANPCQQRDFRKTDEFRRKRRKYMREYRMVLAKLAGRKFKARSVARP